MGTRHDATSARTTEIREVEGTLLKSIKDARDATQELLSAGTLLKRSDRKRYEQLRERFAQTSTAEESSDELDARFESLVELMDLMVTEEKKYQKLICWQMSTQPEDERHFEKAKDAHHEWHFSLRSMEDKECVWLDAFSKASSHADMTVEEPRKEFQDAYEHQKPLLARFEDMVGVDRHRWEDFTAYSISSIKTRRDAAFHRGQKGDSDWGKLEEEYVEVSKRAVALQPRQSSDFRDPHQYHEEQQSEKMKTFEKKLTKEINKIDQARKQGEASTYDLLLERDNAALASLSGEYSNFPSSLKLPSFEDFVNFMGTVVGGTYQMSLFGWGLAFLKGKAPSKLRDDSEQYRELGKLYNSETPQDRADLIAARHAYGDVCAAYRQIDPLRIKWMKAGRAQASKSVAVDAACGRDEFRQAYEDFRHAYENFKHKVLYYEDLLLIEDKCRTELPSFGEYAMPFCSSGYVENPEGSPDPEDAFGSKDASDPENGSAAVACDSRQDIYLKRSKTLKPPNSP